MSHDQKRASEAPKKGQTDPTTRNRIEVGETRTEGRRADMQPRRVQRKRTKGWRMPANTVYVGRGSAWGNPWREGSTGWTIDPGGKINREPHEPLTREQAIESYRNSEEHSTQDADDAASMQLALAGKDLACWCPLDKPCHADVLLELANQGTE